MPNVDPIQRALNRAAIAACAVLLQRGCPMKRPTEAQTRRQLNDTITGRRRWTLIEGDCLDWGRAVPDSSVDAVITDPPYGVSYCGKENKRPPIANDKHPFVWWLYDAYRATRPGGALLCFCPWRLQQTFHAAIEAAGYKVRSQVIWDRASFGMGDTSSMFAPAHDVVWFATKGRFKFPGKRPKSIIQAANVPATKRVHSTQKPLPLMTELVEAVTPGNGVVFDPCAGSGSTGDAAVRVGRRFIGIELDAHNAATARQRMHIAAKKRGRQ